MINKTELERFLVEKNSRISVDKLLSEYRGRLEISIFIGPWAVKRSRSKKRDNHTKLY